MLDKHGIWPQCAIVFKITMAISCFVSIHWESLFSDIAWSIFFIIASIIQFYTEEHRTFQNITPEKWCKYTIRLDYSIKWIISTWIIFNTYVGEWLWVFIIILACNPWTLELHKHHCQYILPGATILYITWNDYSYAIVFTNCIFIIVTFLYSTEYKRILGTSHACKTIKHVAAYKTLAYVVESVILWQVRCLHRFPYVFRWNPLTVGIIASIGAVAWCHLFTKKTSVSRNSIIQRLPSSHTMAFSLTSASKCSICTSCLTSLDMESSFSE